jgi:hypothetical protein
VSDAAAVSVKLGSASEYRALAARGRAPQRAPQIKLLAFEDLAWVCS